MQKRKLTVLEIARVILKIMQLDLFMLSAVVTAFALHLLLEDLLQ